jgi:hypothetical protein
MAWLSRFPRPTCSGQGRPSVDAPEYVEDSELASGRRLGPHFREIALTPARNRCCAVVRYGVGFPAAL